MKKTKFIALALVVAVMLMGAGYAAWSEQVTISSTIETGNLSVALADGTVAVYQNSSELAEPTTGMATRTATARLDITANDPDSNKVDVNVTNLYPGARVKISIPIANDGNIPVKLDTTDFVVTGAPAWLTATKVSAPSSLAVNANGDIVYTFDISSNAVPEVPENGSATFSITANYVQFN